MDYHGSLPIISERARLEHRYFILLLLPIFHILFDTFFWFQRSESMADQVIIIVIFVNDRRILLRFQKTMI